MRGPTERGTHAGAVLTRPFHRRTPLDRVGLGLTGMYIMKNIGTFGFERSGNKSPLPLSTMGRDTSLSPLPSPAAVHDLISMSKSSSEAIADERHGLHFLREGMEVEGRKLNEDLPNWILGPPMIPTTLPASEDCTPSYPRRSGPGEMTGNDGASTEDILVL